MDASTYYWQTARVRLRAVEPGDADVFHRWQADGEMAPGGPDAPFPISREALRGWAGAESNRQPDGGVFRWMIDDRAGVPVGTIRTFACDPQHGTFAYELAIAPEHRRQGYATDAIRLVLRYFFAEWRFQKVTVRVPAFNTPAIRLHERLGFQPEGRVRRMLFAGGRFHDELVFGLTADELPDP